LPGCERRLLSERIDRRVVGEGTGGGLYRRDVEGEEVPGVGRVRDGEVDSRPDARVRTGRRTLREDADGGDGDLDALRDVAGDETRGRQRGAGAVEVEPDDARYGRPRAAAAVDAGDARCTIEPRLAAGFARFGPAVAADRRGALTAHIAERAGRARAERRIALLAALDGHEQVATALLADIPASTPAAGPAVTAEGAASFSFLLRSLPGGAPAPTRVRGGPTRPERRLEAGVHLANA